MRAALVACAGVALAGCGGADCPESVVVEHRVPDPEPEEPGPPPREPAPRPSSPDGFTAVTVEGVMPGIQGNTLILLDESRGRMVPVIIGDAEAMVIGLRLRGEDFRRPLTHDLLDTVLGRLEGEVVSVQVNKLRENIFVGTIVVWDGRETHRIDSRTSDAVAVALGHDVPIYVADVVIEETGMDAGQLPPGLQTP